MPTVCSKSNASSKTWVPLPDHFIDDHLVEMFPLFDLARLQMVDVTNLAAVHALLQLPSNMVVDWIKVRAVGWSDEVWYGVSCVNECTVSHALWDGRLSV